MAGSDGQPSGLDRAVDRVASLIERMPRPEPNSVDAEFWAAIQRRELTIQTCEGCSHRQHPPFPVCERCRGTAFTWEPLSGSGKIFTYTVVHHPPTQALVDQVPYVLALIELEGGSGSRMLANVPIEGDPAEVSVGDPVLVHWLKLADGIVMPCFVRQSESTAVNVT